MWRSWTEAFHWPSEGTAAYGFPRIADSARGEMKWRYEAKKQANNNDNNKRLISEVKLYKTKQS